MRPQWLSRVQLCDPMNCSPPGSSIHGIFQARILEWVVMSSSSESSWPIEPASLALPGRFFTTAPPVKAPICLVYSQMGHSSIPSQFKGILWLGSNVQILLKAEIGDYSPTGRKKDLTRSLSKSLLMFEASQKSPCSLITPIIPVQLWMQPLHLWTWTQLSVAILHWSDSLSSLSMSNMSHK